MNIKVLKVKLTRNGESDIELTIPLSGAFASVQILDELLNDFVDNTEVDFTFYARSAEL